MITEQDFENQVAEMLSRRSLDVQDVAVLAGHLLTTGPKPSSSKSHPQRNRIRVLVAALVLSLAGTAAFVAARGSSSQSVRTAAESSTTTLNAPPATPWGTRVPSARLFPDGFDLANAPSLFSTSGGAETAAVRYIEDRLPELSPFFTIDSAELSNERDQALFGWSWTEEFRLGAQVSGWIYVSLADGSWHIRAATTEGVDLSGLRFTADGLEGVITSADFNSLTANVWIAPTNELSEGAVEPLADDPFSAVSTNTSEVGTVDFEIRCLDQYRAVASILVEGQPVSISEHLVMNDRPDRMDCEGATFEADFGLDPGPATTEDPADRAARTATADTDASDIPLPLLTLNAEDFNPSLQLEAPTAFLVEANGSNGEDSAFVQAFTTSADRFEGPMVLIETAATGDTKQTGFPDSLDSFEAADVTFYIWRAQTRAHVLISYGPGAISTRVTGVNMTLEDLVAFVQRLKAPTAGSLSWSVSGAEIPLQVFEGSPSPANRSFAAAETVGSWRTPDDDIVLLTVTAGGRGLFESKVISQLANSRTFTVSTEAIAGRAFVIIERPDGASVIWMEGSDAVGSLVTTTRIEDIPIRELLGSIETLTQSQWLDLGGTVSRAQAKNIAAATIPIVPFEESN